jgi:hypothetical protein
MSLPSSDNAADREPIVVHLSDHATGTDSIAPAASISGEATMTAHPGGILISVSLWFTWLTVAVERAAEAWRIRTEMSRLRDEGAQFSDLLNAEFEAAMVAIAASAHALDALYGSSTITADAKNHGQNRPAKIREALKRTFHTGQVNTQWVIKFDNLFKLRDAAVHAEEQLRVPEMHPVAGYTANENVTYSAEEADRAVDFSLSVVRWCIDHPRNDSVQWANNMRPLLEQLEKRRAASSMDGT